jgi:M-phase inducer tyrosine phosphatase
VFWDCRWPYEYEGGHIVRAENIPDESLVGEAFEALSKRVESRTTCVVFYCEFSSHRAPNAAQAWRAFDQRQQGQPGQQLQEGEMSLEFAPGALQYPSVFLLEGGYSAFFRAFRGSPASLFTGGYVKMRDKAHRQEAGAWHRRAVERRLAMVQPSRAWGREDASWLCAVDMAELW